VEEEVDLNATLLLNSSLSSLCTVTVGYLVVDIEVTHLVEVRTIVIYKAVQLSP
jgi:hypothetical protein